MLGEKILDKKEAFARIILGKMLELHSGLCLICDPERKCHLSRSFDKYQKDVFPSLNKIEVIHACNLVMEHVMHEATIISMMSKEHCGKVNDLKEKFAKENQWLSDGTFESTFDGNNIGVV